MEQKDLFATLLVSGIIIMSAGFILYYVLEQFEWFFVSFIGILIIIAGVAIYSGEKEKSK